MEEYIGINIGALLTKFSVCEPLSKKQSIDILNYHLVSLLLFIFKFKININTY